MKGQRTQTRAGAREGRGGIIRLVKSSTTPLTSTARGCVAGVQVHVWCGQAMTHGDGVLGVFT